MHALFKQEIRLQWQFTRAIRNTIECSLREHSIVMNRVFDALRCFADLLSYDNKRFAQIALRRIGILSLTRPAAGEESCKAGFLFAHKVALPPYLFASRFSCEHEICLQKGTSEL